MKKLIIASALLAAATPSVTNAAVDPVLAAGVEFHTVKIHDTYTERKKLQEKIIEADAAITVNLQLIHNAEDKILDYMSNASSAVENLYQIKEIGNLISDITDEHAKVLDAIKNNPQGAVFTALASKQWSKILEQMTQASTMVAELVLHGKSGSDKTAKVNLLSAAERFEITNSLLTNLKSVKYSLWLLEYQIRYWTWLDVWVNLDYRSWAKIIGMKSNADYAIKMWNKTFNSGN